MSSVKTMRLITTTWNGSKTFRLIPISNDCPYIDCVYDTKQKELGIVSKDSKDTLHMLPRLDDNGDILKVKQKRENGKTFKEERKLFPTFIEHYITETSEIIELVKDIAVNADSFDFQKYLVETESV